MDPLPLTVSWATAAPLQAESEAKPLQQMSVPDTEGQGPLRCTVLRLEKVLAFVVSPQQHRPDPVPHLTPGWLLPNKF